MNPNTVWFWIVVGVGTIAIGAAGKWVWTSQMNALREWFQAPKAAKQNAEEAKEQAAAAVEHAEDMKDTLGHRNGQGDLMTIASRLLAGQMEMFSWQREHDTKDDQTRADVREIKTHLGL